MNSRRAALPFRPPAPRKARRSTALPIDRAPAPPETSMLTPAQLAAWFQISERQLDRIPGIPYVTLGKRGKRALVRSVLAWLEAQAKNGGQS